MATYAIGDVQGCYRPLMQLLERLRFEPSRDRLWLVGDLVNRGPESLATLRWLMDHDQSVDAVLGNHDLYLLGRVAGVVSKVNDDTLATVYAAKDRDAIIDWLRRRPVLVADDRHVMVHAGLHPKWGLADAVAEAAAIEARLRSDQWTDMVASYFRKPRPAWSPTLSEDARNAAALGVMTRIRFVGPDLEPMDGSGSPERPPPNGRPWFRAVGRAHLGRIVVHGHWASLGLWVEDDHYALDSGCVWGGMLTALRLEDRAVFSLTCRDVD